MEVNNQYQALQELEDAGDTDKMYNNLVSAHEEATKRHIPVKSKVKQHVPWENDVIAGKREAVKEAFNESTQRKTRNSAKKLHDARKELEDGYALEQERYAQEKVNSISNAAEYQKSKLVWETVNEFTGKKGTNRGRIKAKSTKDRVKKWKSLLELCGTATRDHT